MARPYKLIKRAVLEEIQGLHNSGVPLSKLIRDFDLTITNPTLNRLLISLTAATVLSENNSYKHTSTLVKSLFPDWLEGAEGVEVTQPNEWKYIGLMPYGEWLKR